MLAKQDKDERRRFLRVVVMSWFLAFLSVMLLAMPLLLIFGTPVLDVVSVGFFPAGVVLSFVWYPFVDHRVSMEPRRSNKSQQEDGG